LQALPSRQSAGPSSRPPRAPLAALTQSELATVREPASRWRASTAAAPMMNAPKFQAVKAAMDPGAASAASGKGLPAVAAIEKLCDHNFDLLTRELGQLNPQEKQFLDAFKGAPWHLTHATRHEANPGELHLMSQSKLRAHCGDAASMSTTEMDLRRYGNGGYVFFALEAGDELKKKSSRFGDHLYRVPLEGSGADQHGILVLHDVLAPKVKAEKHYQDPQPTEIAGFELSMKWRGVNDYWRSSGLSGATSEASGSHPKPFNPMDVLMAQTMDPDLPDRCFFKGKVAVEALGMAVLLSARKLDDEGMREQVLAADVDNINTAANSIFRPQILIPNEFHSSQAVRHDLEPYRP
jgi:hypothetical protein